MADIVRFPSRACAPNAAEQAAERKRYERAVEMFKPDASTARLNEILELCDPLDDAEVLELYDYMCVGRINNILRERGLRAALPRVKVPGLWPA
jgi:hypothetical protein